MKNISRRSLMLSGAGALAVGAFGLPKLGSAGMRVTAIDGYPAKAMWVREFSNFFIPEVNKRLAAIGAEAFEWQESYGGAIVKPKGVLEGLKLGLGDIGIVTTIFHSSTLPSQAISAVTPFISSDARVVAKAVDEIANEFPDMRDEFTAQGQVYLTTGVVLDSYQLFSKKKVTHVKDIEGMKIAGAGYNLRYLEGIKDAAGVRGGLTDFYNMVQTGVTDGAMLWVEAAKTFGIADVAPHMLRANMGAVNTKTLTANANFWNKLPANVQKEIKGAAIAYRDHIANVAMGAAAESEKAFMAKGGTITDLADSERKAWAEAMPNIASEWAAGLDKKGKNGTKMLKAYIAKLRASGATPARDWSA